MPADLYHRHTAFRHIEFPTFTAVAVMETDFERLDINQCPPSQGNEGPNRFANTDKCHRDNTEVGGKRLEDNTEGTKLLPF